MCKCASITAIWVYVNFIAQLVSMLDIKEISPEFEKQSRMDRWIVVTLKSEQRIVLSSTVSFLRLRLVHCRVSLFVPLAAKFDDSTNKCAYLTVCRTRCLSHSGSRSCSRRSARARKYSAASTRRWCVCTARASSPSRRPFPPRPAAPPPPPRRASLRRSNRLPRRRPGRRVQPPTIARRLDVADKSSLAQHSGFSAAATRLPRCSHTTRRIRNLLL